MVTSDSVGKKYHAAILNKIRVLHFSDIDLMAMVVQKRNWLQEFYFRVTKFLFCDEIADMELKTDCSPAEVYQERTGLNVQNSII